MTFLDNKSGGDGAGGEVALFLMAVSLLQQQQLRMILVLVLVFS